VWTILAVLSHCIEQPHSSEVNADIVTRVVGVVKTLIIPSYLYVFNETSGATSENLKVWLTNRGSTGLTHKSNPVVSI
jgi:hypothetical protein